ncbi:hypothetical protein [Riemerella columbina]|uniref:hypothetical protein n=1 Tax=Riemerella columbina TaxID=103810 RepID=UPI0026704A0C|nr:hypothetical protein [Riemerella columbina]WKS95301.1 hypothetical protein NYR17_00755 [Riemerella columbina]
MKKIIAFLYVRHKNDKRVSDIAHLQTFVDIFIVLMFPYFFLEEWLNIHVIMFFRKLANGVKWLEYVIGISCFVIPLYIIFRYLFPEVELENRYKSYTYPKYYLLILRVVGLFIALTFLFLTLELRGYGIG